MIEGTRARAETVTLRMNWLGLRIRQAAELAPLPPELATYWQDVERRFAGWHRYGLERGDVPIDGIDAMTRNARRIFCELGIVDRPTFVAGADAAPPAGPSRAQLAAALEAAMAAMQGKFDDISNKVNARASGFFASFDRTANQQKWGRLMFLKDQLSAYQLQAQKWINSNAPIDEAGVRALQTRGRQIVDQAAAIAGPTYDYAQSFSDGLWSRAYDLMKSTAQSAGIIDTPPPPLPPFYTPPPAEPPPVVEPPASGSIFPWLVGGAAVVAAVVIALKVMGARSEATA